METVCIVGASGKLGQYLIQHALDKGWQVNAVCRSQSLPKLERFKGRISLFPGMTDDPEVISRAVKGCSAVLCILMPWGMQNYASGTANAVLNHSEPNTRLIFSCGWHISRDRKDKYPWHFKTMVKVFGYIAKTLRWVDVEDQVTACDLIFASHKAWTVVRASDLEEGASVGLPVWSKHVGDPLISRNLTRRTDFALFMVEAVNNKQLIQVAPAISGS